MSEALKVRKVVSEALGELPLAQGGGSFTPSGIKRETLEGEEAANTAYVESGQCAKLKVKLNALVNPEDFSELNADTLTITLNNGAKRLMAGAWCMGTPELSADGSYEVEFNSPTSEAL